MTTQPTALRLADDLDDQFAQGRISNHTGRKAAVELRRLHAENDKFADGILAMNRRKQADEALLRQALDTLAYWLEHGETPGAHDMIQRTHDALQERLK